MVAPGPALRIWRLGAIRWGRGRALSPRPVLRALQGSKKLLRQSARKAGCRASEKKRSGVRPRTYQPVGIGTVVMRAWPPAIKILLASALGRGVARREIASSAGNPPR